MVKYCPKCGVDVEGLLHRCDCCGAELDPKPQLFICGIYDLPECLGFSRLAFNMMEEIEPKDIETYTPYFKQIHFKLLCLPGSILSDWGAKNKVIYSPRRKEITVTEIVDYQEFVLSDGKEKADLVAGAILNGLNRVQTRLKKDKISIETLLNDAKNTLEKYLFKTAKGSGQDSSKTGDSSVS